MSGESITLLVPLLLTASRSPSPPSFLMTSVKQHLHIGAGALGLGLICWLTHRAGFSVFLANRKQGSSDTSIARNTLLREKLTYNVLYHNGVTESVRITDFIFLDEEPERISEVVCHKDTLLLTMAIRDPNALELIIPVICPALLARAQSGAPSIYIIACENAMTSSDLMKSIIGYGHGMGDCIDSFIFPECVVDRICNVPENNPKDIVSLRVERFANLVIDQQPSHMMRLRDGLAPVTGEYVNFVHNIRMYKERKIMLVNGPHLLIAAYIYYQLSEDYLKEEDSDNLPFLLENLSGARDVLYDILEEVSMMFEKRYPSGTSFAFVEQVHERFCTEPDKLSRVLNDFISPSRDNPHTVEFMVKKIHTRVISMCLETRENPEMINFVIDLIIEMIGERRYIR